MNNEKPKLFLNAPIQNGGFDLDQRPGKFVNIQIARALNAAQGSEHTPHLWNNVAVAINRDYHEAVASGFAESHNNFTNLRLQEKYSSEVMQRWEHATGATNPEAVCDDDPIVAEFAINAISELIHANRILRGKFEMSFCSSCEHMVGESAAHLSSCSMCSGSKFKNYRQTLLYAPRPASQEELLPTAAIYNKINLRHERAIIQNVPDRLILSRTRMNGVSLDEFGLPQFKLDPRLGLYMSALAIANRQQVETVCVIQSIRTLANTAPYLFSTIGSGDVPSIQLAIHGFIPNNFDSVRQIAEEIINGNGSVDRFIFNYLPLLTLTRKSPIELAEIPQLARIYRRIKYRVGQLGSLGIAGTAAESGFLNFIRSGDLGGLRNYNKMTSFATQTRNLSELL